MKTVHPEINTPANEPVLDYKKGSPERQALKQALAEVSGTEVDIPIVVGGKRIRTGDMDALQVPHDHDLKLGMFHNADRDAVNDKAGSPLNLLRWISPRTIKETFDPPTEFAYPHMQTG